MNGLEIDWKILVGQIVNFAILFFLLKAVVYKPFLNLLNKRKKKIEEGVNKSIEADDRLSKLGEMKKNMEEKSEAERKNVLMKAEEEAKRRTEGSAKKAEEEKLAILTKARKEAEEIKEKRKEETNKETIENAFGLAEKILKESIDEKKGKQIIDDFLSKLKS